MAVIAGEEVRIPTQGWGDLLRSAVGGDRRITVEDGEGNRFVLISEDRFRELEAAAAGGARSSASVVGLTAREREILQMIGDGVPGTVTAERLGLAPNTVAQHLASVRRKFGVRSSAAAAAAARQQGLIL